MNRILEYILLFVAAMLCQILIFSNINMGGYVNPYMYIMFIILLPMEVRGPWLLLLGAATGVTMDLLSGTAGLYAIATIWVAFVRPTVLNFTAGRDVVESKGIPSVGKLGARKYIVYSTMLVLLFNIVLFSLEAYNINSFYIISLRVVCSTVVTAVIIYFCQLPFVRVSEGGVGRH